LLLDGTRKNNLRFLIGQTLFGATAFNLTDYLGNPER
jgi:hypothetical protein